MKPVATVVRGAFFTLLTAALAFSGPASEVKRKKPRLDLKATPRMAFSPVNVLLSAELVGGDDVEEFYCTELEWDWDDGGKSVNGGDCPPFEDGTSKIERHYTAEHEYRRAGSYSIKLTMRRGQRNLVVASVKITVRPGLGDRTDPTL